MIEWLEQLTEEQRTLAIRNAFAQVASTQEGAVVFAVLFEQLYLFRPCLTPEASALSNYARTKLLDYFGEDVQMKIVEAILGNAKHANLMEPQERKSENGN